MSGAPDVEGTAPLLPVRAEVWGATDADVERAVDNAKTPPSRRAWDFTRIERLQGAKCPIDARNADPRSLAAEAGYGWAYAVYAVRADG